jgi:hypothetical protein
VLPILAVAIPSTIARHVAPVGVRCANPHFGAAAPGALWYGGFQCIMRT